MICYHGSDTIVDNPMILDAKRPLDFGGGFYVTTSKEQATAWAKKVAFRNKSEQYCVSCYEFDLENSLAKVEVLRFDKADEDWLDFVCDNRNGKPTKTYDIVIGPVADDKVYRVVVEYENGDIDKELALKNLKTEVLCDQILFHTDEALKFLKYINSEVKSNE